jgi:hypothetical protein
MAAVGRPIYPKPITDTVLNITNSINLVGSFCVDILPQHARKLRSQTAAVEKIFNKITVLAEW